MGVVQFVGHKLGAIILAFVGLAFLLSSQTCATVMGMPIYGTCQTNYFMVLIGIVLLLAAWYYWGRPHHQY